MDKIAFIWRESIYNAEENGIYRCNVCKCKILDANTGENAGVLLNGRGHKEAVLTCPDCGNAVAFVKKVQDEEDGVKRGLWKGEE